MEPWDAFLFTKMNEVFQISRESQSDRNNSAK